MATLSVLKKYPVFFAVMENDFPSKIVLVLVVFGGLLGSSSSTIDPKIRPADDDNDSVTFLFGRLLQQYSSVKTRLILCSLSSSLNEDAAARGPSRGRGRGDANDPIPSTASAVLVGVTDSLARCNSTVGGAAGLDTLQTDSMTDARLSGEIGSRCRQRQASNLERCISRDTVLGKLLGNFVDKVTPGVLRMCCLLEGCGLSGDEAGRSRESVGYVRWEDNPCLACLTPDAMTGTVTTKATSSNQSFFLKSFSNMFCTNLQYNKMPCTKLNLVALNLLSSTSDPTIISGATDILVHCYPSFQSESVRIFQTIVVNLTAKDTSRVKGVLTSRTTPDPKPTPGVQFLSGGSSVTKQRMSDLTARAKTGLVVMGILVLMSLGLGVWVIYHRARSYLHPNEAVRYSQISINDIYIDDENRDDDDEEDDDDVGEGVPTPYRS